MTWAELYSEAARPTLEEIDAYAHTPLWPQLRAYLAAAYGAGLRVSLSSSLRLSTAGAVWSRDGM